MKQVRYCGKAVGTLLASLLVACGGGSGGTSANNNTGGSGGTTLSGIAAAGAPVGNGIGYALDAASGTKVTFTTNSATGSYNVDLTGKSGPFLLHVRGITTGGAPVDLYSLASSANLGKTVNVTPLSDVVVGYAAGQTAAGIETSCTANLAGCPTLLNGIIAKLALSNSSIVKAMPAAVLNAFGVNPATFDAITTSFAATHSGVDGLLDALQVVPPVAAGAPYAINLVGPTPTPLVTVPIAGTATAPTTSATAPTATAITQAQQLAQALAEVQAAAATFNQSMTAAAPALPSATKIGAFLDPSFKLDGMNNTTFSAYIAGGNGLAAGGQIIAGGLAPYAGAAWSAVATAPAANITYDANNCVTALWVHSGSSGLVTGIWQYKKTITNPTGCVGTWLFAGNQDQYYIELVPIFTKFTTATGTSYSSGFHLSTSADETVVSTRQATPYASITISGPGLTTKTNFAAKGSGVAATVPVTLVPPTGFTVTQIGQGKQNRINDPYYPASSVLEDCAALTALSTGTTPCFDSTAAIAGSDYVVKFNSAAPAVLETVQHRLNTSLALSSVPTTWYATITGVTPTQSSLIPVNTASTVKTTWTLPAGAVADWGGIYLYNAAGATIWQFEQPVTTTTSNTINVPATNAVTATPAAGSVGVIAPIGGLKVVSQMMF